MHADRLLRLVVLLSLFAASAAVWWPVQAARIKEVAGS
jgi:flagellar P-ring protein precursor FlgI